jgi:hypothetical protein
MDTTHTLDAIAAAARNREAAVTALKSLCIQAVTHRTATKIDIARAAGISRPTLDAWLVNDDGWLTSGADTPEMTTARHEHTPDPALDVRWGYCYSDYLDERFGDGSGQVIIRFDGQATCHTCGRGIFRNTPTSPWVGNAEVDAASAEEILRQRALGMHYW